MKAFADWLKPDGTITTVEIPASGWSKKSSTGSVIQITWDRPGGICVVSCNREDLDIDMVPVAAGCPRTLEHLDEIAWAGHVGRFRRVPSSPEFHGEQCSEIPLDSLPDGTTLVLGRAQAGPDSRDTNRVRWNLDPEDSGISRNHVEISREPATGRYRVRDTSTYGTMLNSRAFKKTRLVYGDRLRIRDYHFEFTGTSLRWVDGTVGGEIRAKDLGMSVGPANRKKIILQDATVAIKTGEFIGILGGSGQGKSTFMNALCGVNPATSGTVEINGIPLSQFKDSGATTIGYVPQEDLVHRELLVKDAIRFSARLRLRLPQAELDALVEGVMEKLGLQEHREKRVGDLSGGQRKRVSIATELLAKPSILFLDEPSSGLDPESERRLMEDLQTLSLSGLTIIATTHVLATAKLLDRFCFIHAGRILFIGRGTELHDFLRRLKNIGQESSPEAAVAQIVQSVQPLKDSHQKVDYEKIYELLGQVDDVTAAKLREEFHQSPLGRRQEPPLPPAPPVVESTGRASGVGFAASLAILCRRQWKIMVADRLNLWFLLAQAAVIGALIGAVCEDNGLRMFLAMIATLWFGCSNAAQQIVGELPIFRRERVAGLGQNGYLMAKLAFLGSITCVQSLLLLLALIATSARLHPVDLPYEEFATDLREGLETEMLREYAASKKFVQPLGENEKARVIEIPDVILFPWQTEPGQPVIPDWQTRSLWLAARYLHLEINLLDCRSREITVAGAKYLSPGLSVWSVLGSAILLRLTALLAAAMVGVAIGLTISAIARSPTQAVLWVPLILIPQILLGGYVVSLPEMTPSVRTLASVMPSAAAQKILDTSMIYGQRVPLMTNLSKLPAFMSSERGDRGRDEVIWSNPSTGDEMTASFDRLSPANTAWQNLLVDHRHVGQHDPEAAGVDDSGSNSGESAPRTTNRRGDVILARHALFELDAPALRGFATLNVWLLACYGTLAFTLNRRQFGK